METYQNTPTYIWANGEKVEIAHPVMILDDTIYFQRIDNPGYLYVTNMGIFMFKKPSDDNNIKKLQEKYNLKNPVQLSDTSYSFKLPNNLHPIHVINTINDELDEFGLLYAENDRAEMSMLCTL
jgi:hypothetical protein